VVVLADRFLTTETQRAQRRFNLSVTRAEELTSVLALIC
jgi:hypothetical protein